jgi:hypothetical protein
MANHCTTRIYVSGPSPELAQLRNLYPFDPEAIVPMPADLEAAAIAEEDQINARLEEENPGRGPKAMSDLRYFWRLQHWGVKYVYETDLFLDEPARLGVSMETPWSPATGVLQALSERFPALEFAVVAHDECMPCAFAWRYVAGFGLDYEAWHDDPQTVREPYSDCSAWVGARITAHNANGREAPPA